MATVTVDTELLERVVKQGVEDALLHHREMMEEAFLDVLEDIGLAKAMEEETGESVSEETIFGILDDHADSV